MKIKQLIALFLVPFFFIYNLHLAFGDKIILEEIPSWIDRELVDSFSGFNDAVLNNKDLETPLYKLLENVGNYINKSNDENEVEARLDETKEALKLSIRGLSKDNALRIIEQYKAQVIPKLTTFLEVLEKNNYKSEINNIIHTTLILLAGAAVVVIIACAAWPIIAGSIQTLYICGSGLITVVTLVRTGLLQTKENEYKITRSSIAELENQLNQPPEITLEQVQ